MATQNVISMQNCIKAMWKWRKMAMMVSILRLKEKTVQKKKAAELSEGKKKWKAYPFLLPKHRPSKTQKGTLCRSIPKGKV